MWGRGPRGNSYACSALCQFSVTSSTTHNQIGTFWCWFQGGWACVHSRTLWVSPTNSPVRLGVSLAATSIPIGVFNQWLENLFPQVRTLDCLVCLTPQLFLPVYLTANVGPPIHQLRPCSTSSLPGCLSLPLLLVWMTVSSLTPWLSDFHTVQFSVSSGCFLFLNLLLSFFWLCEEAQCACLCLHIDQKSH